MSWEESYISQKDDYEKIAEENTFKGWEKIKSPSASSSELYLDIALSIRFANGDIHLSNSFLRKSILRIERIFEDKLFEKHSENVLLPLEIGNCNKVFVYANFLLNQAWDEERYNLAIVDIYNWCFSKLENPRWDELTKRFAYNCLKMCLISGNDNELISLVKKLSRLSLYEEEYEHLINLGKDRSIHNIEKYETWVRAVYPISPDSIRAPQASKSWERYLLLEKLYG